MLSMYTAKSTKRDRWTLYFRASNMMGNILLLFALASIWKPSTSSEECVANLQEILVKVQELEEVIKNHIPEGEEGK